MSDPSRHWGIVMERYHRELTWHIVPTMPPPLSPTQMTITHPPHRPRKRSVVLPWRIGADCVSSKMRQVLPDRLHRVIYPIVLEQSTGAIVSKAWGSQFEMYKVPIMQHQCCGVLSFESLTIPVQLVNS